MVDSPTFTYRFLTPFITPAFIHPGEETVSLFNSGHEYEDRNDSFQYSRGLLGLPIIKSLLELIITLYQTYCNRPVKVI